MKFIIDSANVTKFELLIKKNKEYFHVKKINEKNFNKTDYILNLKVIIQCAFILKIKNATF